MSSLNPDYQALLSKAEEHNIMEWLKSAKVQALMKQGADFAVVFSRRSGIGVTVTATVKAPDGTIISEDVTDYASW
jgi:hypothetical protein